MHEASIKVVVDRGCRLMQVVRRISQCAASFAGVDGNIQDEKCSEKKAFTVVISLPRYHSVGSPSEGLSSGPHLFPTSRLPLTSSTLFARMMRIARVTNKASQWRCNDRERFCVFYLRSEGCCATCMQPDWVSVAVHAIL